MKRSFNQETYDWDLNKSSILKSPRFQKYDMKNISIPNGVKKIMISYVDKLDHNFKEGIGLYFYSRTPGSGKTTCMCIILKELMRRGFRVYCDSLIEIKTKLKDEFDSKQRSLLESMKNVEVLAIDDIGSETMSNWLDEVFKELLDHRYNMQKPTLFTSNVAMDLLPFSLKSRDRLKEISMTVNFPEQSFRKTLDSI
ncbi:MAG: AAA family ATPase [Spirochaetia bacterium]|nr:AAA family ATPase [Spirochaetia bacterium]